jgi:hypothetical protein
MPFKKTHFVRLTNNKSLDIKFISLLKMATTKVLINVLSHFIIKKLRCERKLNFYILTYEARGKNLNFYLAEMGCHALYIFLAL